MFASHPETKARLDALGKVISGSALKASALVAGRYTKSITFTPAPVGSVAAAAPATAAPKSGLGLGGLSALGREKSSDDTVASGGSRGVNPDRDAPGGPNKALVAVALTPAELAEFRKGIAG
jgi:hypothetical protein